MPVTPLLATGRFVIHYTSDLSHRVDMLCDVHLASGVWKITNVVGDDTDGASAATQFVNVAKPFFAAASTFDTWEIQEFSGGAYIQRAVGSIGVAGTGGVPVAPGSMWTFTFRDQNNKAASCRLLGTVDGNANKYAYGVLASPTKAFVDELLNTATTHVGNWRVGRGGVSVSRFLSLVVATNRKSRRRLSLV